MKTLFHFIQARLQIFRRSQWSKKTLTRTKILKISLWQILFLSRLFLSFLQIPTICLSSEAIKLKIEDVVGLLWNDLTAATTIGNLITEQKENSVSSSNRFIVQTWIQIFSTQEWNFCSIIKFLLEKPSVLGEWTYSRQNSFKLVLLNSSRTGERSSWVF